MPSITIAAAVAKDRVIMWHEVPNGKWNGDAAASMYEQAMKPALARIWPGLTRYIVVEDGDRKGNMSGKGTAAKSRAKITAMTLPPRTPSLMPLDYAIWHRIMQGLASSAPKGRESREAFCERLRRQATSLPRGYVRSVIAKMPENIRAIVSAKGYTPKND